MRIHATASLRRLLTGGCAAAVLLCAPAALAQTALDIPPGDLGAALAQLGRQTGASIVADAEVVRGRTAPALRGTHTPAQALDLVLVGSGLAWRTTAAGAYVVESAPRAGFQEAEGGPAVSEVVVTGSRVIRDGSAAPTPLTVVSLEQLREAAPATIADALNQLPVFQNSLRPTTAGSSATGAAGNGGNYLNLRSLGPARTLVLLDGRRSAPSNTTGTTDVNLFPQLLVQRVDVVTGGASAAYGSDAVTGVVNFALDNDFSGWKAELQGGVSGRGDNKSVRAALAHGRPVLDGRGHLLLSAEYFDSAGIGLDYGGRRWAEEGWSVIPNPSGPPSQLFAPDLALSDAAPGGLIVSPGPLAGTLFLAGGATRPAQFGAFRSTSTMSGGDGARPRTNLVTGVETATLFGRFDYNLADGLNAFLQVALSEVETSFPTAQANWQSGGNRFTIFSGNPFLPANIQAVMTAQNIASFSMGRFNSDWVGGEVPTSSNLNRTHSLVAGLEGKLAGSWNWSAYAAHGRSREKRVHTMLPVMMNLYRAADAVRAPDGRIVCRSTLTNPADGCVPINLFGPGSASKEAIDYVNDEVRAAVTTQQDVAAAEVRGELLTLPTGPLAVAAGMEWRRESARQTVDSISASVIRADGIRGLPATLVGQPGGFWTNNPQPISGEFSVAEGFLEAAVPVFREAPFAHSLDLNGAVRYAEYSTAGGATTWKLGATWSPVPDLRFRATRSRDVRAPNIAELFTSSLQTSGQAVRDPARGGVLGTVTRRTSGNPDLLPEEADTTTLGVVLQPRDITGFSASLDYYSIEIAGAIASPSPQDIVDRCFAGNTALCGRIGRDPTGVITSVVTPTLNLTELNTWGLDIELGYRTSIADGAATFRALATYVGSLETTSGAVVSDSAGTVGRVTGVPSWRATLSARWARGPFSIYVQERFIDEGLFDNTLGPAVLSEADNSIDARFYTDLTLSWELEGVGRKSSAFLTINNLFDQDPPIAPSGAITTPRQTNFYLYDVVGREFTAGVRLRF